MIGIIRWLLEKLFKDFIECALKPGSLLSEMRDPRLTHKAITKLSKSRVNEMLKEDSIRRAFWEDIGLPLSLIFPDHSNDDILYGSLSDNIHNPTWNVVYVPSSFPVEKKVFYDKVGILYNVKVEILDVTLVAAGKE